uniref:Uncharacterized protein n=1 Tax=Knipowitschia caucasica TaxID=637954 RepID=A0AAV2MSL0_KNICA
MEEYEVRSAASILASVKEQEARFEQLTRALEEERRNVNIQLERANLPPQANATANQPHAWQQMVMQIQLPLPLPPPPSASVRLRPPPPASARLRPPPPASARPPPPVSRALRSPYHLQFFDIVCCVG